VVVDDFDGVRVPIFPDEADAPLVIDADAMLALPLPLESFERLPGGTRKSSKTAAAESCVSLRSAVR